MQAEEIKQALLEAVRRAGSQSELARAAGMTQGRISDYLRGQCAIGNITADTLIRLFPELRMLFFEDPAPRQTFRDNHVSVGGAMTGLVVQGGNVSHVRTGDAATASAGADEERIDRRELERKIRKSARFSAEEQIKILDFLDEEV